MTIYFWIALAFASTAFMGFAHYTDSPRLRRAFVVVGLLCIVVTGWVAGRVEP